MTPEMIEAQIRKKMSGRLRPETWDEVRALTKPEALMLLRRWANKGRDDAAPITIKKQLADFLTIKRPGVPLGGPAKGE